MRNFQHQNPVFGLATLLVYLFLKIIGLVCFSIKVSSDRSREISFSLFDKVYNGLLTIVMLALSIPAVHGFLNYPDFGKIGSLSLTIGMIKAICGTTVTLTIWIIVSLRQRKAVDIAKRILAVDRLLLQFMDVDSPGFEHLKMAAIVWANLLIFVNVLWLEVWLYEDFIRSVFIITIVPNVILNWFLVQYSLVVVSMEAKFRAINRGILRLSGNSCSAEVMKNLHEMMTFQGMLYTVCGDVADFYGFPTLLIIGFLCGALLTTSYYMVVPILTQFSNTSLWRVIDSLAYLIMHGFPIVVLTTSVTSISREVALTAAAVHDLLGESLLDRRLKSELKIFSVMLLHRRLQFSCCGIFPLDSTLLHSVASMIGTYLVILVQFEVHSSPVADVPPNETLHPNFNGTCAWGNCARLEYF